MPVILLSLVLTLVSCARSANNEIPKAICGTPIEPALTRLLVTPTEGWREYSRVDRAKDITAPCLIFSGNDVILRLLFSWRTVATDLMYLAKGTGAASGITEPRSVSSSHKTLIGTDGAISQAPCKTKGGDYFTLTLQLPKIKPGDGAHRGDIERFMRVYFPATVRTLGCR
ncbi:hypothetical protein [Streptomyces collinus]|uniref:hypothetical protein n=1 Tax=Streptomyces collinus TaxID=42684 RepID=UPI0029431EC3|nr:hypothetical protein [Streptomyces collinus]